MRERGRRERRGGDEKDRMRGRRDEEQRLTRDESGNKKIKKEMCQNKRG